MEEQFKKVQEASYLSTEKSWAYRAILRFFYVQHERMREFLLPEEVFTDLKKSVSFHEYTIEELHVDLGTLVRWGNLHAQQESGNVKTIEEYKRKRFSYQCTPYTVEFERMLTNFEQMGDTFGGSLEKTQFERLYQSLQKVVHSDADNDEACAQNWDDVLTYFKKITQNTSDYFAYLRSEDANEQMRSEAFLLYKDQFTTYLRDFIISLQRTASRIQELLNSMKLDSMNAFFEKVIKHEEKTFRFEQIGTDPYVELVAKWESLKDWFTSGENSQYETLQRQTNDAIRRITRIVQRLGERSQQFRSRKDDYLHLANWFEQLESIEQAHELSAVVFGVFHTRHFHVDDNLPTDDIYTDIWNENPMNHETLPKIRAFRERTKATEMADHSSKKEAMKRRVLEERKQEQKVIESYMREKEIVLDELPVIEPYVRKLLLTWIGKAMVREDRTIKTEFGTKVKVILSKHENIQLKCDDGVLEMPNARFVFIKDGVNG
ncbi:TIGR02677 family protein [Sporosarcina limicola]|uniref:Uncharacterized protein (TIGR02677 family) n=1 Tax=Sporosarcina limicola TaxID=34101 RepID=A0A927MKT1_9BACL|nr:TIGR02677 family protein [Sporosarcina limicola]MBE1556535.1 uncharacterized protein (TIGR02677 family) [Sporosarcina limicola]